MSAQKTMKLVLVGTGGVGKSCLTLQFIANRFVEEYDPTLEDSYRKVTTIDGQEYQLDIFDTAGQEDFSAVRDQYMASGEGFLCVYSVTNEPSFREVAKLHNHILRVKDSDSVPFIIVGNKCDLEEFREVSKAQAQEVATKLGVKLYETSAKERLNVDQVFHELVREVSLAGPVQNTVPNASAGSQPKGGDNRKRGNTDTNDKEKCIVS